MNSSIKYNFEQAIQILERTPSVLNCLLLGLDKKWLHSNEGGETWSPFDVVGHLLHGERTDWMARINKTLSDEDKHFETYNRLAQFEESKGKTIQQLLAEFEEARLQNLVLLRSLKLQENDFDSVGIHPAFGEVTLRQLLSTWTAHDLAHIVQIARTMARQYKEEVGPWAQYLSVMQ
jgi:hypothetical protein